MAKNNGQDQGDEVLRGADRIPSTEVGTTGYTVTPSTGRDDDAPPTADADVERVPDPDPGLAGLAGIDFASDEAAELASKHKLQAAEFDGFEPSAKGGFSAADVRSVYSARKAE